MNIKDRFWQSVERLGKKKCWPWKGSIRPNGYGRLKHRGKTMGAHRVSYEVNVGPIPAGLFVCHKCDNPQCVNPRHLFVGTQKENLADRAAKGRFNPPRGEAHGRAKLTEAQVREIITDRRSQREIAAQYGVDRAMISHIKRGHSWKHVPRK